MTSSPSGNRAGNALQRILALLDEARLQNEIDDPINTAADAYGCEVDSPVSHRRFHEVISGLVRHVYRHGLQPRRELSPTQACAEAIALLEGGYGDARARGYDAALVDVADSRHDGMSLVLARLAEIIKDNARRTHHHWVFAVCLGRLTWADRCRVAELLLERLRPCLTPQLQRCVAAQVVDEIPALITAHLSSGALLHRAPDLNTLFMDN